MNVDFIVAGLLIGFFIIAMLYLVGCEHEEHTILSEYNDNDVYK